MTTNMFLNFGGKWDSPPCNKLAGKTNFTEYLKNI